MKSSTNVIALFVVCILLGFQTQAQKDRTVKRSKKGIVTYFSQLIASRKIIVGQFCETGIKTAIGFNEYVETLHDSTKRYPALVGYEYGYSPNNDFQLINSYVLKHWNRGGLVTINWHADNPWVNGYDCRWNSINHRDTINFKQLLKNAPDSKAKANYRQELSNVGHALQQLQAAGVVVLWRPFHEMNAFWFWWGINNKQPTNTADFILLWKDMYDYFTKDLKLNNLIWIYSPNAVYDQTASISAQYPGGKFVDIVGVDVYGNPSSFADYAALKAFNKPIVLAETGPVGISTTRDASFDANLTIETFKGKAAYFMLWSSLTTGRIANLNLRKMTEDPSAVTLDKLKLH